MIWRLWSFWENRQSSASMRSILSPPGSTRLLERLDALQGMGDKPEGQEAGDVAPDHGIGGGAQAGRGRSLRHRGCPNLALLESSSGHDGRAPGQVRSGSRTGSFLRACPGQWTMGISQKYPAIEGPRGSDRRRRFPSRYRASGEGSGGVAPVEKYRPPPPGSGPICRAATA